MHVILFALTKVQMMDILLLTVTLLGAQLLPEVLLLLQIQQFIHLNFLLLFMSKVLRTSLIRT